MPSGLLLQPIDWSRSREPKFMRRIGRLTEVQWDWHHFLGDYEKWAKPKKMPLLSELLNASCTVDSVADALLKFFQSIVKGHSHGLGPNLPKPRCIQRAFEGFSRYLRQGSRPVDLFTDPEFEELRNLANAKMRVYSIWRRDARTGGTLGIIARAVTGDLARDTVPTIPFVDDEERQLLASDAYSKTTALGLQRRVQWHLEKLLTLINLPHYPLLATQFDLLTDMNGVPYYTVDLGFGAAGYNPMDYESSDEEDMEEIASLTVPLKFSIYNSAAVDDIKLYLSLRPKDSHDAFYLQIRKDATDDPSTFYKTNRLGESAVKKLLKEGSAAANIGDLTLTNRPAGIPGGRTRLRQSLPKTGPTLHPMCRPRTNSWWTTGPEERAQASALSPGRTRARVPPNAIGAASVIESITPSGPSSSKRPCLDREGAGAPTLITAPKTPVTTANASALITAPTTPMNPMTPVTPRTPMTPATTSPNAPAPGTPTIIIEEDPTPSGLLSSHRTESPSDEKIVPPSAISPLSPEEVQAENITANTAIILTSNSKTTTRPEQHDLQSLDSSLEIDLEANPFVDTLPRSDTTIRPFHSQPRYPIGFFTSKPTTITPTTTTDNDDDCAIVSYHPASPTTQTPKKRKALQDIECNISVAPSSADAFRAGLPELLETFRQSDRKVVVNITYT
ncbi:hypothetical protein DFS34DRAFT_483091 [Phlyctochytrium arcticum]|nr:hypothetical protein DFS34DRAFT_483091 [Phlyctochytrium arcticum]